MAELSLSRNRKSVPKVDLTAMVDLAFLLITFFMLTTSLSKPVAMDIAKPDDVGLQEPVAASRTMTILLGKNNMIAWYMGETGTNQPVIESFKQISKSIIYNKNKVASANNKKQLFVIIKPTAGSKYKNFVDIMDELNVAGLKVAPAIDDNHLLEEELAFMKQKGL
jgi:biopolymer transport protein ExbD